MTPGWDDNRFAGDIDVRHIQPYQAVKTYRCPGCDHEIRPGTGHEVVVPVDDPDRRRHWHTPCWRAEVRRRTRAPRRPRGPADGT
ncbi:MAG TPA: hypothetical protein VFF40_08650 [Acidimicrobiia bacterium]|nr:hypothetical protein [Acidimicrobiia bacterium]